MFDTEPPPLLPAVPRKRNRKVAEDVFAVMDARYSGRAFEGSVCAVDCVHVPDIERKFGNLKPKFCILYNDVQ